jgi:AcrR family transcriptional regulator
VGMKGEEVAMTAAGAESNSAADLTEQPASTSKRREEILAAALRVFSELGYARATIKRIAAAAGLRSPALLYWYFPDKATLCRAVLLRFGQLPSTLVDPPLDVPPEQFLTDFAHSFVEFFRDPMVQQVYRLALVEPQLLDEVDLSVKRDVPRNGFTLLERYFSHLVETGTAQPHDPRLATRVFIGTLWAHVGSHHFFSSLVPGALDSNDFIAGMVPLFLRGLLKSE